MELREQAKKLYECGERLKDISEMLDINYNTVKQWRSRYKWIKPKSVTKKNKKVTRKVTEKIKKIKLQSTAQNEEVENKELTEKQRLFCLYYIRNFNATQAYLKAYKCSYNVANAEGYKLLVKPCVRKEIERLKEIKRQSIMINEDDIVERYMRIAFADMTDFVDFGQEDVPVVTKDGVIIDEEGKLVKIKQNVINFKDSEQVDGGLICEIKQSRQGVSVKLEDRSKALDSLAKFFEMNPEHKHKKEHDIKKLQLERERFEHIKKMDELKDW